MSEDNDTEFQVSNNDSNIEAPSNFYFDENTSIKKEEYEEYVTQELVSYLHERSPTQQIKYEVESPVDITAKEEDHSNDTSTFHDCANSIAGIEESDRVIGEVIVHGHITDQRVSFTDGTFSEHQTHEHDNKREYEVVDLTVDDEDDENGGAGQWSFEKHNIRTSTGEYSFEERGRWRNNEEINRQEESHPISCSQSFLPRICNKTFKVSQNSKKHTSIHTNGQHAGQTSHYIKQDCDSTDICEAPFEEEAHGQNEETSHPQDDAQSFSCGGFHCKVCDTNFNLSQQLQEHMWFHYGRPHPKDGVQYFETDRNNTYTDGSPFERSVHEQNEEKIPSQEGFQQFFQDELFRCKVCDEEFKSSRHLQQHTLTHTGGHYPKATDPYSKTERNDAYVTEYSFAKYAPRQNTDTLLQYESFPQFSSNKLFLCKVCDKKFKSSRHLQEHILTHMSGRCLSGTVYHFKIDQNATCIGGPAFEDNYNQYEENNCLRASFQQSDELVVYNDFDETLKTSQHLQEHMLIHTGGQCPGETCHHLEMDQTDSNAGESHFEERAYEQNEPEFYQQESSHRFSRDKLLLCKICDEKFNSKGSLQEHIMTHNIGQNPRNRAPYFQNVTHITESPFKKTDPGINEERVYLQENSKKPLRDELFLCKVCGEKFQCNRHLEQHIIIHSKEQRPGEIVHYSGIERATGAHTSESYSEERAFGQNKKQAQPQDRSKQSVYDTSLPCKVCGKKFNCSRDLQKHMFIHSNGQRPGETVLHSEVERTGFLFGQRTYEQNREVVCPQEGSAQFSHSKSFLCEVCGQMLFNQHLKKHMLIHTNGKHYNCSACFARFSRGADLKRHLQTHRDKQFCCPHCSLKFKVESHLLSHLSYHANMSSNQSSICTGNFRKNDSLERHLVERERRQQEIHLKSKFPENYGYDKEHSAVATRHLTETLKERSSSYTGQTLPEEKPHENNGIESSPQVVFPQSPYSCSCTYDLCPAKCTSTESSNDRMLTDSRFTCSLCSASFHSDSELQAHLKKHFDGKFFFCEHCPSAFEQSSLLQAHLRLHSDELPLRRRELSKFSEPSALKALIVSHLDEQPYRCAICTTKFGRNEDLQLHLAIHGEEYSCPYCLLKFRQAHLLTVHLRTHGGKRPFSCPVCRAQFTNKYSAKEHLSVHSEERPYSCSICHEKFKRRVYMTKHLARCRVRHAQKSVLGDITPEGIHQPMSDGASA